MSALAHEAIELPTLHYWIGQEGEIGVTLRNKAASIMEQPGLELSMGAMKQCFRSELFTAYGLWFVRENGTQFKIVVQNVMVDGELMFDVTTTEIDTKGVSEQRCTDFTLCGVMRIMAGELSPAN